jgi:tetratricopeptide (TPR) repeat protein
MNLDTSLAQLEQSQLVRPVIEPDPAYIFKHVLTQESAYQSLLKTQRRQIHQRVAEAIERAFAGELDSVSDVLAYHWEQAEVPERARHYLVRAGRNAARRFANQEAVTAFTRALALAEDAPSHEVQAIYEARAESHYLLTRVEAALADGQAALALAQQAGRLVDESRIMTRMATLQMFRGDAAAAVELARRVEANAQALQDPALALSAIMVVAFVAQNDGRISEAYPRLRHALFVSREADKPALQAEILWYLALLNNFMGRFGRAVALACQGVEATRRSGDRGFEPVLRYTVGLAEACRGNYDTALAAIEAGHTAAQEIQLPLGLARYGNHRGFLCSELGDWETAYQWDVAGLEPARAIPSLRQPEVSTLINLALDCVALGNLDEGEMYLHQAEATQHAFGMRGGFHAWRWQTRIADARARLLLARSQFGEAAQAIAGLLGWAACTQARKYLARGLILRAQVHSAAGDLAAAEADLREACAVADGICYFPVRLEARRALSHVHKLTGAHDLSTQIGAEVAQLVADLDRRLQHPELRRSFARGLARDTRVQA